MPGIDADFVAKVRATLNLTPNTETSPEDVFIVGYPKSGHTWFQNLVAGVVFGVDLDYAPFSVIWDLVPPLNWPFYKRYGTPSFFKSHDLPRPSFQRVVYLLRDGRDVMVSYFHHVSTMRRGRGQTTSFLEFIQGKRQGYRSEKWHEHVEAWLENPYGAQMLTIRYEELKQDTVGQLQRFCEFAGVEREISFLASVAEKASFAKMRTKEGEGGMDITPLGGKRGSWPRGEHFVRRGQVGSYRDEMPGDVLDAFLGDAGETLRRLGYL